MVLSQKTPSMSLNKVETYKDYNRMVTITRVSNGVGMAQQFDPVAPPEALQYSEIIQSGYGEINTKHQQDKIEELQKQLQQKEQIKKQNLKNIIGYYYKR